MFRLFLKLINNKFTIFCKLRRKNIGAAEKILHLRKCRVVKDKPRLKRNKFLTEIVL